MLHSNYYMDLTITSLILRKNLFLYHFHPPPHTTLKAITRIRISSFADVFGFKNSRLYFPSLK